MPLLRPYEFISEAGISEPPMVLMTPLLPYPLAPFREEWSGLAIHLTIPGKHLLSREYKAGNDAHMMARLHSTVE